MRVTRVTLNRVFILSVPLAGWSLLSGVCSAAPCCCSKPELLLCSSKDPPFHVLRSRPCYASTNCSAKWGSDAMQCFCWMPFTEQQLHASYANLWEDRKFINSAVPDDQVIAAARRLTTKWKLDSHHSLSRLPVPEQSFVVELLQDGNSKTCSQKQI